MVNAGKTELGITTEQEKNWQVARRINRETRADSDSPYAGKYIGVWNEEVVVTGETLDEVCDAIKALGDLPQASVV